MSCKKFPTLPCIGSNAHSVDWVFVQNADLMAYIFKIYYCLSSEISFYTQTETDTLKCDIKKVYHVNVSSVALYTELKFRLLIYSLHHHDISSKIQGCITIVSKCYYKFLREFLTHQLDLIWMVRISFLPSSYQLCWQIASFLHFPSLHTFAHPRVSCRKGINH
jgi:hypothetical protein